MASEPPAAGLTLGFDTSAAHCAAALVSGEDVLASSTEAMRKGQAERLVPLLEEILAEAGVAWTDLGAIGVGIGPGNFTGTRISVAAARGLALALGIPAEGVTSVEAMAVGRDVVVCLPAPRGEVHLCHGGDIRTCAPAAFSAGGSGDWTAPLTGPAAEVVARATWRPVVPAPDIAISIARIAGRRAASGRPRPAPLYLRPADAAPAADPSPVLLP